MFGRHHFMFGPSHHTRLFEKGALKYVILDQLKDKPAHGYEIIRALENRFQGFYSPSAGSVYPTLQLLEDMGYVKSAEQDGKKIYTITEEGKTFLKEREETIGKIKDHMHHWGGPGKRQELREMFGELRDMGLSIARESRQMEPEKMAKIKEIIAKARREVNEVISQ
jgi:DNA-binding PadR family transcriptional regulator